MSRPQYTSLTRSAEERAELVRRGLWSPVSLGDHLRRLARDVPDRQALADGRTELTYSEYWEEVAQLATSFIRHGIGPGDRIGIMAGNCVEFCLARLAASEAGAISVILHSEWAQHTLDAALEATRCRGLVVAGVPAATRTAVHSACSRGLVDWVAADEPWPDAINLHEWRGRLRLPPNSDAFPSTRRDPTEIDDVLFTSGTTGHPRPVMSSQCRWTTMCDHQRRSGGLGPDDVGLVVSPVGGSIGYLKSTVLALLVGGTTVLSRSMHGEQVLAEAAQWRATWLATVPTVSARIVEHLAACDEHAGLVPDLPSLRVIFNGGAPLAPRIADALRTRFGCFLLTSIGSTEAGAPAGSRLGDTADNQVMTVGSAYPGGRVAVLDAEGKVHATGVGELISSSPSAFDGYLGDPAATSGRYYGQWLRHGDEVELRDDGYIRFAGRLDDTINRGGSKISPAVVEAVLARHPAIHQVAVFAIDDDHLGQRVGAAFVLRPGVDLDEDQLVEWLIEHAGRYERPDVVYVLDRLPETPNRKQDRAALEALGRREPGLRLDYTGRTGI